MINKDMKFFIVGLGLLGGAYAKALKKNGYTVYAADINEDSIEYALENNITLTIYSLEMAKKLNDISEKTGITANIHIKIDTGMSRIGFEASEESIDQIVNISNLNNLYIDDFYLVFINEYYSNTV